MLCFHIFLSSTRHIMILQALFPPPSWLFCILYWCPLQKLFFIFMGVMNSSTQDTVFGMFPSSTRLVNILQVFFPPPCRHCCILYQYSSQKLFFIFMVVMNSSTKDVVFGIFPSSPRLVKVLEVLFPPPSRRFCISYWYTSQKLSFIFMAFMNSSTYGIVFGMFPSSPRLVQNLQVLFPPPPRLFFHFILVSIVVRIYFHGIQEQFHIGYCVWNASLLNPAREDFVGIIPFSIPIFLHFILVSIAETVYFHGIHGQYHIGCFVWNVYLLQSARKVFIGIILFPILFFLDFILVSIFHFMVVMNSLIYNTLS